MPDLDGQVDYIEDDVLRLIFLSCHPSLTAESRAALTLRLVGGLTTAEIARGFLATESTMGQRISRAKKTLSAAHAEFELPTGPERTRRLDDVMAVIYLIFNEGYTATAGEDWMRPDLANEAMRLARMLAALAPDEPEVLGLQALLEIQGSRMAARLDEHGAPVLLEAQDRKRWDQLLIRRGTGRPAAGRAARRAREAGREVLPAGLDRRPARPRRACRGHELAPDRGSVRRPGRRRAGTGRRGEPGGRARAGVRPGRGACRAGGAGRRCARRLAARAECARRPARAGRAARAGRRGVHRGGRAHQKRERACRPAPSGRAEPDARVDVEVTPDRSHSGFGRRSSGPALVSVQIATGTAWATVSADRDHTCAVSTDGVGWCRDPAKTAAAHHHPCPAGRTCWRPSNTGCHSG